ncbi:MAG: stage III sporulation protein AB [Clostridiales bacterium]|jgi:stage III sporulation protein AB|nr:stage III sporulation protein AB [Clostridiales bacterium]
MLSIAAGAALFVACLYGGVGIKHYYKTRAEYFARINDFCNLLIDEISNLKTPLIKILENFAFLKKDELSKHITAYAEVLSRDVIPYEEQIRELLSSPYLKKEEIRLIADFLMILGRSRSESQVANIKHYKNKFEEVSKKAGEAYTVQGALAYKLGILLGIALMIIVV